MEAVDQCELCLIPHCCSPSYKLPAFLSDHLDELTGRARENPSTDKALFPACVLKDTSCPLSREGNWTSLFHGESSACGCVCVCVWDSERVWNETGVCVVLLGVIVMHLSESGDDRQQIRGAEARWLMPTLSEWQRWTYHCVWSPASSLINLICLVSTVEASLSAGTRRGSFKNLHSEEQSDFRGAPLSVFCAWQA